MATPSAGAEPSSDALARLRIQRAESHTKSSRFIWLLKAILVSAVVLGLAVAGVLLASKKGWLSAAENWVAWPDVIQSRPEVELAVVTVESGRSADATVVATGYLESRRQAQIGARAPGRIEVVNVEEGTRVKTDEILAVLEHADLDAALAAAEATVVRAKSAQEELEITILQNKRAFDRAEQLRMTNSISDTEYDTAEFTYKGAVVRRASLAAETALAAARVREAEQMKSNMFIRAPFNGTVISKDAEVGESILPGGMGEASGRGSVVTVADLDHLEVDCDVKEDYISRVATGQAAEVAVDAVPDRRYQARVRKIIPMGDRARATIKVKVEITNVDERLFPEMSATVYFLPRETIPAGDTSKRRVFCDSEAIHGDNVAKFVWTLDREDRVRRVDVKTGPVRDSRTEITNGLAGDERVILAPPDIKTGQRVKIAQ